MIAGQPTPETHPEILKTNEIQPGITSEEFSLRRERLASLLPPGGVAVIPAAPQVFMAGVIPYPYRQDADFMYLTGIAQPQSIAVIDCHSKLTLFVPDSDPWREQWDGSRVNVNAAIDFFNADEAYTISEMQHKLPNIISSASAIVCDPDRPTESSSLHALLKEASDSGRLQRLRPVLHKIRWIKSAAELDLMSKASTIAAEAMIECMRVSKGTFVLEHTLASLFEFKCKSSGAHRMAYPPVVAGGSDSCTIHYSRNDKKVSAGNFLKLDGGCELYGYCSDVTRTWSVGGRYSAAQRDLYDIVLSVHVSCLKACKPGTTLRSLHHLSIELLADGLSQLGICKGMSSDAIASGVIRTFYPHSIGHWLGLDTHDSSTVSHDKQLEAGVVLTIEPGLYIPNEPGRYGLFAGLGVRIEDVVAVTQSGADVLSGRVPIDIEEIQRVICN